MGKLGHHPQIPTLKEYFTSGDSQYLVQEYIHGTNLAEELVASGPWNETEIRKLLQDLLPILQSVHGERVIHRDIKPENILRRPGSHGTVDFVLVDFGAAKYVTATTLGKTGTVIGSAAYTAPEQVRGKAVFASDIYSLGVTCVHLLTGVSPFDLFDNSEQVFGGNSG